ncbi:hypothetical protein, partial [Bacillus sp. SIMBA_005]|uniref:hypothetical protein n=1 Tax=Bacillus sp. SIMBA_005 TaxID=3085754 RepID=UPI00397DCC37
MTDAGRGPVRTLEARFDNLLVKMQEVAAESGVLFKLQQVSSNPALVLSFSEEQDYTSTTIW